MAKKTKKTETIKTPEQLNQIGWDAYVEYCDMEKPYGFGSSDDGADWRAHLETCLENATDTDLRDVLEYVLETEF